MISSRGGFYPERIIYHVTARNDVTLIKHQKKIVNLENQSQVTELFKTKQSNRGSKLQAVPYVPAFLMPRAVKSGGKQRHDPLHVQLGQDEILAKYGTVSRPGKRKKALEEDDESGEVFCHTHIFFK